MNTDDLKHRVSPCDSGQLNVVGSDEVCCCGPRGDGGTVRYQAIPGCDKSIRTDAGLVPVVPSRLQWQDWPSTLRVRMGIGRMNYQIQPGLYAVGSPGKDSSVVVSANFKLSFDHLRRNLDGRDAWILVLDTKGINVWCAAGKGTFGTEEIVNRLRLVRLSEVVDHRRLILPQLGAPGVAAHLVKKRTKFAVKYGPVRAADLQEYLDAEMKATSEMRAVRFSLGSRLLLVPIELYGMAKWVVLIMLVLLLLSGLGSDGYSLDRLATIGPLTLAILLAAFLAGTVLVPAFLPWLPGRAFSVKGAWAGVIVLIGTLLVSWQDPERLPLGFGNAGWILIVPAVASFLGMNFTGSSTYTSLSGVKKEMRLALPLQIAGGVLGLGLWLVGRFV